MGRDLSCFIHEIGARGERTNTTILNHNNTRTCQSVTTISWSKSKPMAWNVCKLGNACNVLVLLCHRKTCRPCPLITTQYTGTTKQNQRSQARKTDTPQHLTHTNSTLVVRYVVDGQIIVEPHLQEDAAPPDEMQYLRHRDPLRALRRQNHGDTPRQYQLREQQREWAKREGEEMCAPFCSSCRSRPGRTGRRPVLGRGGTTGPK